MTLHHHSEIEKYIFLSKELETKIVIIEIKFTKYLSIKYSIWSRYFEKIY